MNNEILGDRTMTFTIANCLRTVRSLPARAGAAGCAAGLLAALGSLHAAPLPAQALPAAGQSASATLVPVDPARTVPGELTVSRIDFKRGDGGAGQLIVRFSGDGAMPDMHPAGSRVVIDVANATLPPQLQKPVDVSDFATPVERVVATRAGVGTRIVLETQGSIQPMAYQTGNDYIVEVAPRPTVAAAGAGNDAATGAKAYSGHRVTFNFQDVPVRTVLQLLAEEAKVNLVVSDSVAGNVTLRLVDVPWDQALDILLRAKSLDKRQNGNVMWVAPQAEIAKYERDIESARLASENNAEVVTEYIPISYGSAEDIAKLLTEGSRGGVGGASGGAGAGGEGASRGFLSPRGSISFDQRTNTLLVIDIPSRVEGIKRLVQELDKPVDQVVIEARIVIANESFARELGTKFGVSGSKDNTYFSGDIASNAANRTADATANQAYQTAYNSWLSNTNRYDPVSNPDGVRPPLRPLSTITQGLMTNLPGALAGGTGSLALSILNAGYLLDVELSAMQTEGRGEIISNPRIVTSNQKEALIRQGDQIGYVTTTGGQQGNLPSVQFKDAILQLKVTPTITADGRVFLNMDVQKDDLSGFVNTGVGQVPQIATRQVTTSVLVDDGQTVVIGGVYEFKDQQDVSKVPFLADLPVLGNLFKKRNRTKSKAELLIMVTPKVIRVAQHAG
jgi:type IV pilus assembly protein PilQ